MIFRKSKNAFNPAIPKICIGNKHINQENCVKFLGPYLDNQFLWVDHLKHCKAKIASSLYAINTVKNMLSLPHLKTLYRSLIHSHLDYGIILWGTAQIQYIRPLINKQNKAIRLINGASYNCHTAPLYNISNILPLMHMHTLQLSKFMFQFFQNILPTSLKGP